VVAIGGDFVAEGQEPRDVLAAIAAAIERHRPRPAPAGPYR
jgi:hypothetical protein